MWAKFLAPALVVIAFGLGAAIRYKFSIANHRRSLLPTPLSVEPKAFQDVNRKIRRWIVLSLICWFCVLVLPLLYNQDYASGVLSNRFLLVGLMGGSAIIGVLWGMKLQEIRTKNVGASPDGTV